MMHGKLGIAILIAAMLSWLAAGAVFASPMPRSRIVGVQQAASTPPPSSGSTFLLDPAVTSTVTSTITSTVTPTTTVTPTSTLSPGNEKIAKAIANYFGVGEGEVLDIHDQAHGWGQVFFVFALANMTGESPDDIWAMRESGKGWGSIFMDHGLKPGHGKNNLGGAITGRATPTVAPTSSSATNSLNSDADGNKCNGKSNNKGKGNPCANPGSTPVPGTNSSGNNGKGKGPK